MNLKQYFTFSGRINRIKYLLVPLIISSIITIFTKVIGMINQDLNTYISIALIIASIYVSICLIVMRLHDMNRSGYHFWLLLVPLYNIYLMILLYFKKGTDGPNKYGDDPLFINSIEEQKSI